MKKIFATVLCLCMVLTMLPVAAMADDLGGSTTGGTTTGGTTTGGTTTGGTTTGGSTTGGTTTGGSTTGGSTTGGSTTGGSGTGSSAGSTGSATVVNPFDDVAKTTYYYDALLWAIEEGITDGTSATTFSPNLGCTRAQMVTFLWRVAGKPEAKTTTHAFTDVDENAYYYQALLWAIEKGITNGTSATTFSPDAVCTRGQMAAFLFRDAGKPAASGTNPFGDVENTDFFYEAVLWAVKESITNGTSTTTFSPDDDCTRAQMVTFLYRCYAE